MRQVYWAPDEIQPAAGHGAEPGKASLQANCTRVQPALAFGPTCRLASVMILAAVAVPLVWTMPPFLRASAIGCTWGALALAGLRASWSERRLQSGVYALFLAQLAQWSMQRFAGLDSNSAWALVTIVLGSGWGVGLVWTPWQAGSRQPVCIARRPPAGQPAIVRWSIWDMACLASGVAVLCWVAPRAEAPLHLICQIAPALVGGLFVSLFAVEWACRDQWSLRRSVAVVIGAPLVCGLCLWLATSTTGLQARGWQAVLRWWLAGPGSVIAAQGIVVLGYLGAARVDTQLAARPLDHG